MPDSNTAFIVGATGQVGKAIVKELARSPAFTSVTLFTRRLLNVPPSDDKHDYSKFTNKIVNFEKLSQDHAVDFHGFDIGFCCIGLGIRGNNREDIMKVDHDYTLEVAKLAKAGGCRHFNLLSGKYASKDSWFFGIKVKGLVEEEISKLSYERFTSVRPGQLVGGDKDNATTTEKLFSGLMERFDCGRAFSCHVPVLAKLLVNNSLNSKTKAMEIFENDQIHKLGIELARRSS